jgi:hypothetical protein
MICDERIGSDADDWFAYFAEIREHARTVKGRAPYLPSPSDIQKRCRDLRWLEARGFNRRMVVNILEHDNPCFARVVQMVRRHGAEEAKRRIAEFLVETEYDFEGEPK